MGNKVKEKNAVKESKFKGFVKRHKVLSWIIGVIIVLLVIARIFLTQIIQTGVSTVAPMITGVPVTIGDVSISILQGYVALDNVKVGNPEGYKAENMVSLNRAVFDIDLGSLFTEKIRIEEITVDGLDLYYEQKLNRNNISDLQANVEKNLGTASKTGEEVKKSEPAKEEESSEPKKLQVDKILLKGITTHVVLSGVDVPVMMVPINMENLGTGPEGITAAGIFGAVLDKLSLGAASAMVEAVKKSGAATGQALKDAGKNLQKGTEDLKKEAEKLKKLFQ